MTRTSDKCCSISSLVWHCIWVSFVNSAVVRKTSDALWSNNNAHRLGSHPQTGGRFLSLKRRGGLERESLPLQDEEDVKMQMFVTTFTENCPTPLPRWLSEAISRESSGTLHGVWFAVRILLQSAALMLILLLVNNSLCLFREHCHQGCLSRLVAAAGIIDDFELHFFWRQFSDGWFVVRLTTFFRLRTKCIPHEVSPYATIVASSEIA